MVGTSFRVLHFARYAAVQIALMLALSSASLADAYRLGSGDRLLFQIMGPDTISLAATIDEIGRVRLPYLGTHQASGKTLDELNQEIALATAGRQIALMRDGRERMVVLGEADVFITIDAYRPVTVLGLVAAPGRIAFEPGMRARTAIGMAGGVAFAGTTDRLEQILSRRTRLDELRETEAWLVADMWRIESLLSAAETAAPPEEFAAILEPRIDEVYLDITRERVDFVRERLERDREDLELRIDLTLSRIDFLETAIAQYVETAANQERRLADLEGLTQRGFATANALETAQLAAFNASARVLTTQADLAASQRDLQSLRLSREGLDAELRQQLLEDKASLGRRLAELRTTMAGVRQGLVLDTIRANDADDAAPTYRIILYRREGGEEVSREIAPGDALAPGDEIEIVLAE